MSGPHSLNPHSGRSTRQVSLALALAAMMTVIAMGPATAATVTGTWNAKVGSAGANGTARIQAFVPGTGALTLKLVRLKVSSTLPVVISKGTCKAAGATVVTVPSIRTTSAGATTKTVTLTAAQIKLIKAATKGSGTIAIRFGTGSSRKCGTFALAAAPPAVVPSVAATIPVGVFPHQAAIDSTGIWVTNTLDGSISRIDPVANAVLSVSSFDFPGIALPQAITTGFGSIWVTFMRLDETTLDPLSGFVVRVDPLTGSAIGSPVNVGRNPFMITSSAEAIWVTNTGDASVSRIDPLTNQVVATIPVGDSPLGIAAGFGSIWVANISDGKVARIDPATNQVTTTVPTQRGAFGLAVGAGAVWVSYCGCGGEPGTVSRIDPSTNTVVAAVQVGTLPGFLAFGGGFVWVGTDGDNTVVQIDPTTNTVRNRIPVGATSWGITASDHAVWVVHPTAAGADPTVPLPGTVTRINF